MNNINIQVLEVRRPARAARTIGNLIEIIKIEEGRCKSLSELQLAVSEFVPIGVRVVIVRSVLYATQLRAMMSARYPIMDVPPKRFFVIIGAGVGLRLKVVPVVIK